MPFTNFYENYTNPGGASSSSSSSSSSAVTVVPAIITQLAAELQNAKGAHAKRLQEQLTVEMNKSLAGTTNTVNFDAPKTPDGMRYCTIKRRFVEIYAGSSSYANYGKSKYTSKKTKPGKEKKEEDAGEEKMHITCDECNVDCTASSWYYAYRKKEKDYCPHCATENVKKHSVEQRFGLTIANK